MLTGTVSKERAAAYAEGMKRRMKQNSDTLANKEIKAYEKCHKICTYQPGEKILVDVRTEPHEKKKMHQAKVVKLANGGYYKVEWLELPHVGKASYVPVDHVEPFKLRKTVHVDSESDKESIKAEKVCWDEDDCSSDETEEAESHLLELARESCKSRLAPVDEVGNKRSLSYFFKSGGVEDYGQQPRKRFRKAPLDY